MAIRTVRLDEEAEQTLARLRKLTGLSMSEVFKRGLVAYKREALSEASHSRFELFGRLDLGPGGYAEAPARRAKRSIAAAIRKKHRR